MKKIILAGLCGLGLVAACAFATNVDNGVSMCGHGGLIDIM